MKAFRTSLLAVSCLWGMLSTGCAAGKHSTLVAPGPPKIQTNFDFEQLPRFKDDYCAYILYTEGAVGGILANSPKPYCEFADAAKTLKTNADAVTDPKNSKSSAKQAQHYRDKILDKFMAEIDHTYHEYSDGLYMGKSTQAVAGDIATLGLTAATSISLVTRTKTILASLATGVAGVNLSIDKNFYGQQTFSALGIAMQARRDKAKSTIDDNRSLTVEEYTLEGVRRDLVAYFFAGTLPGAIQEIQEEASAASKEAGKPKDTPAVVQDPQALDNNSAKQKPRSNANLH